MVQHNLAMSGEWFDGSRSQTKGNGRLRYQFLLLALLSLAHCLNAWYQKCDTSGTPEHLMEIFIGRCNMYIVEHDLDSGDSVSCRRRSFVAVLCRTAGCHRPCVFHAG